MLSNAYFFFFGGAQLLHENLLTENTTQKKSDVFFNLHSYESGIKFIWHFHCTAGIKY